MPNLKSSKKRVRISEERRKRNKGLKTRVKNIKKKLIEEEDKKEAEKILKKAYSAVDKAVKKGLYHRSKGARLKSQMARIVREK